MEDRHSNIYEVEADGVTSDAELNTGSQEIVYIPPGDVRKEAYRLSTFGKFPTTSVLTRDLAKSGFFFTGYQDRTKCFGCGRCVEKWEESDNPLDRKWHKQDCGFRQQFDCGNVPLLSLHWNALLGNQLHQEHNGNSHSQGETNEGSSPSAPSDISEGFNQPTSTSVVSAGTVVTHVCSPDHKKLLQTLQLNQELDRLASYARWNIAQPNISPAALAKNGFFYLGETDHVQCFSCLGILKNWSPSHDVATEHSRHFQSCMMAMGAEARNEPVLSTRRTTEQLEQDYPCRNPWNLHMREEQSRLKTFHQRWHSNKTNATAAQIAEAGFFFLGERDRVKCWYCNGGLQNWEQEDDPWVEHAKWFPTCEFLIRKKGTQFVYHRLKVNAHLPRPTIWRRGSSQRSFPIPQEGPTLHSSTHPLISQQEALRRLQQRVQTFMESSEVVKMILEMGFSRAIVAAQVENKIISNCGNQANSDVYGRVLDLLEDIQRNTDNLEKQLEEKNHTEDSVLDNAKEEGRREAMEDFEKERRCKVCLNEPANVVFIPCGHLCCCLLCSSIPRTCPICRGIIQHRLKIYTA